MNAQKGNGLDATNDQPAKTQTKHATDFKANTVFIGDFPTRRNTVTAEILARLLDGENLTGMDAVFSAGTTRLSSSIHTHRRNSWPIEAVDKVVGTNDGRVSEIRVYYLPTAAIELAFKNGPQEFCQSVKVARAKLRQHAPKAKAQAAKRNAACIVAKFNPNQCDLFSDGSHA